MALKSLEQSEITVKVTCTLKMSLKIFFDWHNALINDVSKAGMPLSNHAGFEELTYRIHFLMPRNLFWSFILNG